MAVNDPATPSPAVNIEDIMQDVREEILSRTLPGQAKPPPAPRTLPPDFYEHLYRASLAQSELTLKPPVIQSHTPIIGPLLDRIRRQFHQLVAYYFDHLAYRQSEINSHILHALGNLEQGHADSKDGSELSRAATQTGFIGNKGDRADQKDVYSCYRLLLNREPDEQGWNYWNWLITNHTVSRAFLVDSFLNMPEFQALQKARNEPVLIDLPGFKIAVRRNDNFIGAVIAEHQAYEPHVTQVIEKYLKKGDTFVDAGANIGYFSLLAASIVGPQGLVVAFEPNPANLDLLRLSMTANKFEDRFDLRPVAIAEKKQTLQFVTAGINSNGHFIGSDEVDLGLAPIVTVDAVPLDSALADCRRVDMIKLDIEGAEALAWQGMQTIISHHRPTLLFEFSPVLLRRISRVDPAAFLNDVQSRYDLFIIPRDGFIASTPDSIETIMNAHTASGKTHLDILAQPKNS